jgi:hypothetical protein
MNILVLGDGNFSFSRDFHRFLISSENIQLKRFLSTSYDGVDDLRIKYPEIRSILLDLVSEGAEVLHNIDATVPLSPQLTIQGIATDEKFEHIFFNFPHLGFEDCNIHSSMIGHIFHR